MLINGNCTDSLCSQLNKPKVLVSALIGTRLTFHIALQTHRTRGTCSPSGDARRESVEASIRLIKKTINTSPRPQLPLCTTWLFNLQLGSQDGRAPLDAEKATEYRSYQ